ncbi:MAG: radical SAM protein [Nanobdellota archaeon]
MKVGYHHFNHLEDFAYGENLTYKEISNLFKEYNEDNLKFYRHDIHELIKNPEKVNLLKGIDLVVCTAGPFSWIYHHLRSKYSLDFGIVHFVHTSFFCTNFLQEILVSNSMSNKDRVVFVSEFQRRLFIKLFAHLNYQNTSVAHPICQKPVSKPRRLQGLSIGFLGDFSEVKGFDILFRTFIRLRMNGLNAELVVCGVDRFNKLPQIKKMLNSYNIPFDKFKVISSRGLKYGAIDEFWQKINLLVFPSLCHEPLGRVLIEASDRGIPVIACNSGGAPEIVPSENLLSIEPIYKTYSSDSLIPMYSPDKDELYRKIINFKTLKPVNKIEHREPKLLSAIIGESNDGKINQNVQQIIDSCIVYLNSSIKSNDELMAESFEFLRNNLPLKIYETAFDLCHKLDVVPKIEFHKKKKVLFVSPHNDDAIFYAGEKIIELRKKDYLVEIVNVFTKVPPKISKFAEKFMKKEGINCSPDKRIIEEEKITGNYGVKFINLGYIDKLYISSSYDGLYEKRSIDLVELRNFINSKTYDCVYMPAGLSGHSDHRAVFDEIDKINADLYLYLDYPYFTKEIPKNRLEDLKHFVEIKNHQKVSNPKKKNELISYYNSQKNFIKKQKFEEFYWKINRIKKKPIPELAIIEVTQKCNLNCIMCYNKDAAKKENISTRQIKRFILELWELGCKMISFTGGEPFLRKDIFELIKFAQSYGIETVIYTNGTLLKTLKHRIIDSGLSKIFISIESGTEGTYEKIRGKNIFKRVVTGTKELIKARNGSKSSMEVRVASLIMKDTVDELIETIDFSRQLGVDGITFKPVTIANVCYSRDEDSMFAKTNNLGLWPTNEQMKYLPFILDELSSRHKKDGFVWDTPFYFQTLKKYFEWPSNRYMGIKCSKGYNYLVLDKDGYVLPCWGIRPIEEWQINNNSLKKIWDSKRYRTTREMMGLCNHPCTDMLESRTYMR